MGQLSQASPSVSESELVWVGLATVGQLSQAFPFPSPSVSVWVEFETVGQLSFFPVLGGLKAFPAQMPSLSWSLSGSSGHGSAPSRVPSPSLSTWKYSYSPMSTVAVPSRFPSAMRAVPSASVAIPAASALFPASMAGEPLAR